MNSDPNKDFESPPRIKNLLADLYEPTYQRPLAKAEEVVEALHRAEKRQKKWQAVGDGGTPQGLDLQEARLAEIEEELHGLHVQRGDFGTDPQVDPAQGSAPLLPLNAPSTVLSPELGSTGTPDIPDAERRLVQLRKLGGDVKCVKDKYSIRGIIKLVKHEVEHCKARCSEKTIRADLQEAFEAERETKRATYVSGLGQR